ncbi:hypothetical protein YK48G_12590 [Lentilactobacillus fungorum]|jgi:sensor domain CHASE-containing protein|uniref:Uncharacterized protein n=1 Tax=Lentilactobacillus fungorum TaxID=2201250 RepID=A0ABQ3W0Z4_9LACO|nr:hypothetical protein [Lentilactobacillus fungorum]GHP13834.1 hypothetical protein YK48G_12590 [Lentilactobacillus fungorum]
MNEKQKAQNAKRANVLWIMLTIMVLVVIAGIVGIIMKSRQTNQYKEMIRQSVTAYNKTAPATEQLSATSRTKVYRVRKSGDQKYFVQLSGTTPKFIFQKNQGKWVSVKSNKAANNILKYRIVYTSNQSAIDNSK